MGQPRSYSIWVRDRESQQNMTSTTATSTTGTAVIATVEALTTEFVAPSTCYSAQLTMLSSPGYEIWLNEPQPVPGTLYPNCYPSQFIDGYSSAYNKSSSIAPMMSPLVAPENWVTAQEMDNGYIALCPSYVMPQSIYTVRLLAKKDEEGLPLWGVVSRLHRS